jgi:peptide/nickel transport system substrate-binding protein/oligopeptide transport system substrate-binding protein
MKGSVRVLGATIALVLVAAACSNNSSGGTDNSGGTGASGGTYSWVNCEPKHLIPGNDYEACGTQVNQAVFTRLVDFDPNTLKPVPAQAESIDLSDDGLTYTITIKPGWTFHNGEPVTAQSYVDAWNYTAYGPNGYILNFFFDKIDGYDAMNPSSGDPTATKLSGLKVVDDTTFTVKLSAPSSQFEYTLGFDAFDPLPKAFYDDPKAFDEAPIGDGPYMMDGKWEHDQTINLQRYPDYAGTPGFADKIELPIYQGDAAWLDFQAGNVDITFVGSDHLTEAKQQYPDAVSEEASSTLLWLSFPLYDHRFDSKELRQALSLAVDRQAVMTAVLVAETPADDFTTPVVSGYRPGVCQYCVYNPDLAKQKLEEAGGWQGEMTLNFYTDTTLEQAMEAIAQQWKDNLGIDVKLNPVNINAFYDLTYAQKMDGPWWDGWVEDYPSLEDYLTPIYGTNGGYNLVGYSNKEFDDLIKQGNQAGSVEDALPFYQQADDIILEDMPAMPWGYLGFNTVHSANVTNVLKVPGLDELDLTKVQVVGATGSSAS